MAAPIADRMLFYCARCTKEVDSVTLCFDVMERSHRYVVECHGDVEERWVPWHARPGDEGHPPSWYVAFLSQAPIEPEETKRICKRMIQL